MKKKLNFCKKEVLTTKLISGRFDATSLSQNQSCAYVIIENEQDICIEIEDTLNAYHGDIVEVEISNRRRKFRHGRVTKVLKRNKENFIGVLKNIHNKTYFIADNLKIHTFFEVNEYQQIQNDFKQKVYVEMINWGLRQKDKLPVCRVKEILGISGNPDVEILSVIKEFGLPLEFPTNVIEDSSILNSSINTKELENRRDLRELFTITIDPVTAKDYDDAVSITEKVDGGFTLYVHIADVTHFVKYDSSIFLEAQNRGNSYYFPNKVIPMLPERLSNDLCSLRPNEDKFTITVQMSIDNKGKLQQTEVFESIIRSNNRLSYDEVDAYYAEESENTSAELYKTLSVMRKLSDILSNTKKQRGYLRFDLPELEYIYDLEGHIVDIKQTHETESHMLIENFMLIANECVAKLLTQKCKHTIYRIHEEPDVRNLTNISDMLRAYSINFRIDKDSNKTWQNILDCLPNEKFIRVFNKIILRSMKKAMYSVLHQNHFGLALHTYTHFTSPIRRFCDLVVHMQLKDILRKEPSKKAKSINYETLHEYAGICSDKEKIAEEAERMLEMKLMSSFMLKRLGETFSAIIIGLNKRNIYIELESIPVRGLIKLNQINDDYYAFDERKFLIKGKRRGKIFKLCEMINVILVGVSDEIVFDIVDKRDNISRKRKKSR